MKHKTLARFKSLLQLGNVKCNGKCLIHWNKCTRLQKSFTYLLLNDFILVNEVLINLYSGLNLLLMRICRNEKGCNLWVEFLHAAI